MLIGIDASRINISERTGTEHYSYHLIKALATIDQENSYILYFRKKPSDKFFESLTNKNPRFSYKVIPLLYLWTQGGLAFECIVNPPDVLFISAHTMPAIKRPRLKVVVTIHGLEYKYVPEYQKFPQKLYLTKSTEFVSKFATHIIAVSNFTKRDLIDHGWGATESRVTVVYEGVDTKHFYRRSEKEIENIRLKYKLEKDYIFFLSTIQPRKNIPGLVEAFSMVIRGKGNVQGKDSGTRNLDIPGSEFDRPLDLAIAGRPGWQTENSFESPKKFGVERRVKFLGYVPLEDLPALFSGSLFYILPSFVEGFGLSTLQAMACGTPVLASNAGAIPEVVGDAGLLFDPNDPSDIAEKMGMVLTDAGLRRRMSAAGKKRAVRFSWEKAAKEMIEVFRKVVNEQL